MKKRILAAGMIGISLCLGGCGTSDVEYAPTEAVSDETSEDIGEDTETADTEDDSVSDDSEEAEMDEYDYNQMLQDKFNNYMNLTNCNLDPIKGYWSVWKENDYWGFTYGYVDNLMIKIYRDGDGVEQLQTLAAAGSDDTYTVSSLGEFDGVEVWRKDLLTKDLEECNRYVGICNDHYFVVDMDGNTEELNDTQIANCVALVKSVNIDDEFEHVYSSDYSVNYPDYAEQYTWTHYIYIWESYSPSEEESDYLYDEDPIVQNWTINWYRTSGEEIDGLWEDYSSTTYGYYKSAVETGKDMCGEDLEEFYTKDGVTYYRRDKALSNIGNEVYLFAISGDNAVEIQLDLKDACDSDTATISDIQNYVDKFTPFVAELLATE